MQPNNIAQIAQLIDTTDYPLLLLVLSEQDGQSAEVAPIRIQIEDVLNKTEVPISFFVWYITEEEMVFPRISTPTLYFFLPKKQSPIFWKDLEILKDLHKNIEDVYKLHLNCCGN